MPNQDQESEPFNFPDDDHRFNQEETAATPESGSNQYSSPGMPAPDSGQRQMRKGEQGGESYTVGKSDASAVNPDQYKVPTEEDLKLRTEPGTYPAGAGEENRERDFEERFPTGGGPSYLRIAVICLVLFLLIISGLIFVNEYGILNLGLERFYGAVKLEKLWGGLGKDGKTALEKSNKTMARIKSLNSTSDFELKIITDSFSEISTDLTNFLKNSQKTARLPLTRVLGESTDKLPSEITIRGDIFTEFSDTDWKTNLILRFPEVETIKEIIGGETKVKIELIKKGDALYLRVPALADALKSEENKWIKIKNTLDGIEISKSINQAEAVISGERVGWSKVGNTAVYVYNLKFDSQRIADLSTASKTISSYLEAEGGDLSGVEISAKIYLGKRDHLLYKEEISISRSGNEFRFTLVNDKFNENGATIEAPTEEEISEGDLSSLLANLSALGYPDIKRKRDLAQIANYLQSYKVEQGSYPDTGGAVIKVNNENGVLYQSLIPNYVQSLPQDPKSPTYWYGYKSDGAKFTLSCVLANKTDPEGVKVGDLYLYYLKSND